MLLVLLDIINKTIRGIFIINIPLKLLDLSYLNWYNKGNLNKGVVDMTAVNTDGQVYFTFEELDFDGAYNELLKSHDLIVFYHQTLLTECDNISMDLWKEHARKLSKAGVKMTQSRVILNYLHNLRMGRAFNV